MAFISQRSNETKPATYLTYSKEKQKQSKMEKFVHFLSQVESERCPPPTVKRLCLTVQGVEGISTTSYNTKRRLPAVDNGSVTFKLGLTYEI